MTSAGRAPRASCATGSSSRPKAEIIDLLNREINAGLADPKLKARFADLGGRALPLSPAEYGKRIAEETDKWARS
jgi:tripartite-type tricarboxylate transporter receptor subunit TctC